MKNYVAKKDLKIIAEMADKSIRANDSQISWTRSCNRIYDACVNGKQLQVKHKSHYYTISKCTASDKVFVDLFQGETANVAVGLDGKVCLHKGGMMLT
jgi:hypothetical protein